MALNQHRAVRKRTALSSMLKHLHYNHASVDQNEYTEVIGFSPQFLKFDRVPLLLLSYKTLDTSWMLTGDYLPIAN